METFNRFPNSQPKFFYICFILIASFINWCQSKPRLIYYHPFPFYLHLAQWANTSLVAWRAARSCSVWAPGEAAPPLHWELRWPHAVWSVPRRSAPCRVRVPRSQCSHAHPHCRPERRWRQPHRWPELLHMHRQQCVLQTTKRKIMKYSNVREVYTNR